MAPSNRRKTYYKQQNKRSHREEEEVKALNAAIAAGAPPPGSNPLALDNGNAESYVGARSFDELPLSQYTKDSLKQAKYVTLTAIQRAALPHALCGRDVLGAAKTGSGKTLAFLIPVIEKLYRLKWTRLDGLGALVLTPTRELAMQIFEELKKVGRSHDFSAALLIGGKNVKEEQGAVHKMNILVCTPGRLLQHMDETPGFDASNLQILVLDEADRILDMGFAATMDAILANLPTARQTLLFSATQTKSVKDLARLSLTDPEYLSVHAEAVNPTPLKLQQAYSVVELHQKMDMLWSFIKAHLKAKTIVFLSTCKQVRFTYEAFKKLRPGVPVRCLHGGMKQLKRMAVYTDFCEAKATVLFATDIAARGLDFPTVDWVVQADCPEDVAAYIHRVGRTARYLSSGRALLLLTPSEKDGMLSLLSEAKVPIKQIKVNPDRTQPVTPALQALLSKSVELKEFAQRALIAYVRSVFLQPNKAVFDVTKLPILEYAQSLGLLTAPKLRFLKRVGKKVQAIEVGGGANLEEERAEADQDAAAIDEERRRSGTTASLSAAAATAAADAEGARQTAKKGAKKEKGGSTTDGGAGGDGAMDVDGVGTSNQHSQQQQKAAKCSTAGNPAVGDDDDDDFLVVKKRDVFDVEADAADHVLSSAEADVAAAKLKKKRLKILANKASGNRVVFDEQGNAVDPLALLATSELGTSTQGGTEEEGGAGGVYVVSDRPEDRFKAAADIMRKRDREDKARLKALRQQNKAEAKARRKAREAGGEAGAVVTLQRPQASDQAASSEDDDDDEDGVILDDDNYARRKHGRVDNGDSDSDSEGSWDSRDNDVNIGPLIDTSSDDDDDGNRGMSRPRTGSKHKQQGSAHIGMERKGTGTLGARDAKRHKGPAEGLSLTEQEAIALALLGNKK